MVITTIIVSKYIADKLVSQFIKEEGYGRMKKIFFPEMKYKANLEQIIKETIDAYSKQYPIEDTAIKFPFYKSQILFELLNQRILYKVDNTPLMIEEFKKNENIIVPEQDQLNLFYKIFIDKVSESKTLKKLYFDESYKEEIFKVSDSLQALLIVSNTILEKVNSIDQKLDSTNSQIGALRNRFSDFTTIHNLYNSRGLNSYVKSDKSSNRVDVIDELFSLFSNIGYVHLNGNISMGKTQLAALMCEKFINKFWIEFKDIEAKLLMQVILQELSSYFKITITDVSDVEKIGSQFPDNSILVLDDLPKLNLSQRDMELFISMLKTLAKSNVKILATSNFNLPSKIVELLDTKFFIEKEIPFLTEKEIYEILVLYGSTLKLAELIKKIVYNVSSGHPAIVNAICRYLVSQNWDLDEESIVKIFSGNFTTNLDEETLERILITVQDGQAKDLLYRLKIVIGDISDKEIESVSVVNPSIKYPFEKVTVLSNLWLQKVKTNHYQVSPLIKRLKVNNLSSSLIISINKSLGELVLSNKKIDQISANKAILYFINSESYNRAGFILSLVLEESLKNEKLFFDWGFGVYWTTTSLPEKMDIFLQSVIRYLQISLYLKQNKNSDFLLADLEIIITKASKKNINLFHASFLLSIIYSNKNSIKSNEYLLLALRHFEELKPILKGNIFSEYPVSLESLIWNNLLQINSVQEFSLWLDSFSKLSNEQMQNSLKGDLSKVACLIFCSKAYDKTNSSLNKNWNDLFSFYETIIEKTNPFKIKILLACCIKFQIRCLCSNLGNYQKAIATFNSYNSTFKNDDVSLFLINDELGRQLFYLGRKEISKEYLLKASLIETSKFFTEKIDTYLALNEIFGNDDISTAHTYISKAFELQKDNEFVDEVFSAKVIGEYAISNWQLTKSKEVFYIIEIGIEKLLFSYKPLKEYQGTIIRFGHILNYYFHLIAGLKLKDVEGSPYAIPFRGCFSKDNERLLQGGYYFEQKKFMLAFMMVQAFEEVDDKNLSSKWAGICFELNDEEITNPFTALMTGLTIYLILEDKFEEAILKEIDILKSINELNSVGGNKKIDNERLAEIVKERPITIFDDFDVFIFTNIIQYIVIKLLKDYVLLQDPVTIEKLKSVLVNSNLYFNDKKPLEILINACDLLLVSNQQELEVIDLKNVDDRFSMELTVLLYLFASLKAYTKRSLQLHLALIQRLEMVSTKVSSKGAYKFLVVPFILDFWNARMISVNTTQTDPCSPFQIDPLKTDVAFRYNWV